MSSTISPLPVRNSSRRAPPSGRGYNFTFLWLKSGTFTCMVGIIHQQPLQNMHNEDKYNTFECIYSTEYYII